jgi:hypothetical protein
LIRFREKEASEYYYADTFPCEKLENKTCTNYLLNKFSDISQIRLKVTPNEGDIENFDSKVQKILESKVTNDSE